MIAVSTCAVFAILGKVVIGLFLFILLLGGVLLVTGFPLFFWAQQHGKKMSELKDSDVAAFLADQQEFQRAHPAHLMNQTPWV
jgi:hypothetical protein